MNKKIKIIAEVKTKSPFGWKSNKSWDELFQVANKTGDIISIHTKESLDKLKSIAEDLDINLDPGASTDDIIDRIRMAVKENEDGNPNEVN